MMAINIFINSSLDVRFLELADKVTESDWLAIIISACECEGGVSVVVEKRVSEKVIRVSC